MVQCGRILLEESMNKEWEKIGKNVRNIIEDSINAQNFYQLNQTITNTINETVNSIQDELKKNQYHEVKKQQNTKPELFKKNTSVKAGGMVLSVCGWTFSVGMGIAVVVLMLVGMFLGSFHIGVKIALSILLPLLVGSSIMAWKGNSMLSALKRYQGYITNLHGRTYCNIKELADKNGKSFHFVLKDVKRMIEKGWFLQGHLDYDNTCLIVSHDTYQEYENIRKQRIEQREQQKQPERSDRKDASMNSEVQKVVLEGKEYIRKIQKCNQAISEKEISRKISHMEMLIQKIFDRVKEDPDSLEDIQKLMEYYLPTTVKLLDAYQQ